MTLRQIGRKSSLGKSNLDKHRAGTGARGTRGAVIAGGTQYDALTRPVAMMLHGRHNARRTQNARATALAELQGEAAMWAPTCGQP